MRMVLTLVLSCTLAGAQTKAERGRQIIDQAIEALGGNKFLAVDTRVEKGRVYSFYREKLSGLSKATIYTQYLKTPDPADARQLYLRERQAFGDDEAWSVLFNEEDGWEITFRGARPLKEETVERFRDSRWRDIFYILLRRLNEPGMIFEYRDRDVVDNKPMEIVEITDSENRAVTVYFDYSTKLPGRQVFYRRDEDRVRHEELTIFDKYRDVGGGVQFPFVVQKFRDGEKTFSMFAESIEINVPLVEGKVSLPGNIKMLERQK